MKSYFVNVLGIKISLFDLDETILFFTNTILSNSKIRICVLPVNCILWGRKDKRLNEIYNGSDINLADGVPVVWASKLLGNPIHGRVTGLDLLPMFAKVAAEKGFTFFFLGAKKGVAEKLREVMAIKHPSLKIIGHYSPPFTVRFSGEENRKMINMINKAKPNVLWVSLTAPKQDIWIYENFDKLNVNIAIGVGGAFEVTGGLITRSPRWMQKCGLEWFYRFLQEPKRLYKRYFFEAPMFIPLILMQKFRNIT